MRYNIYEYYKLLTFVTIALKKCYNYVKCIDILAENYKIDVYHVEVL